MSILIEHETQSLVFCVTAVCFERRVRSLPALLSPVDPETEVHLLEEALNYQLFREASLFFFSKLFSKMSPVQKPPRAPQQD